MAGAGGIRLFAVDALAAIEGLRPDQSLADARALVPELRSAPAEPHHDRVALTVLADWCRRYTPSVAFDGDDGLLLDITGCAHLFGGEEMLHADISHRLARSRIAAKVAIADTPAAAWAVARFATTQIMPPSPKSALTPLPTAALRLPAPMIEQLHRLGLRRVGDLLSLPRASLVARFGAGLAVRLDQLLGRTEEPMTLRRPVVPWRCHLAFAEPIGRREDIDAAMRRLLDDLTTTLGKAHRGARKLELLFCRVDGAAQIIVIGTARPTRDTSHLARLFAEELDTVDAGFGIETMILEALESDVLMPDQTEFAEHDNVSADLAPLIDRLRNRLGDGAVFRVTPVASHIPERAIAIVPALSPSHDHSWPDDVARPVRLLPCPEPIEATAHLGDEAPSNFRWRSVIHRVVRAEGPERIAPEWWHAPAQTRSRDYYWIEDEAGRRFWVYCALPIAGNGAARWYLHGLFA